MFLGTLGLCPATHVAGWVWPILRQWAYVSPESRECAQAEPVLPACHIPGPEQPGPPLGGGRASGQACSRTGVSSSWNCFLVCSFSLNLPAGQLGERTRPWVLQGGISQARREGLGLGDRKWQLGLTSIWVQDVHTRLRVQSEPASPFLPGPLFSCISSPGRGVAERARVASGLRHLEGKGGMQAEALSLSPSALPELPVLVTCRHPQKVLLSTRNHRALILHLGAV